MAHRFFTEASHANDNYPPASPSSVRRRFIVFAQIIFIWVIFCQDDIAVLKEIGFLEV